MKRRTKIVCTLGPAVESREAIKALIAAGMNVARINCAHGDWDIRRKWVEWVRELSPEAGPVGVLVDLQGPKFRIGPVAGGAVSLGPKEKVIVGPGAAVTIPIPAPEVFGSLGTRSRILLGDGEVELRIGERVSEGYEATVVSGGTVKSRQGITIVGKTLPAPAMTDRDRADAEEACKLGAEFIALSYVRSAPDLGELHSIVEKHGGRARVCAKIETAQALKNLDEVLGAAHLAMVARGDLGLQIDLEEVPLAQKRIIRRCNELGKPVITATQMLESMIRSPRPTRAEAGDVANAILDGTDAVMLSAETAIGDYPIEAVSTMSRIARETEPLFDHAAVMSRFAARHDPKVDSTQAIAHAAVSIADFTKPAAILTTTTSGQTACLVSRFRPSAPILCATWDPVTQRQMSVVWGVEAIHVPLPSSTDEIVSHSVEGFKTCRRLKVGETVIITAGVPAGTPGNTNLILYHRVA